jgi:hypothetical protein
MCSHIIHRTYAQTKLVVFLTPTGNNKHNALQVLHCHNCEDPSVKIAVCCQSCDSSEFGDPLLPMILCADCNLGFHVS